MITSDNRATITVEEAGRILGISRSAAYRAANVGQIPTIRIGRRLLVPAAKLKGMLGQDLTTAEQPPVSGESDEGRASAA